MILDSFKEAPTTKEKKEAKQTPIPTKSQWQWECWSRYRWLIRPPIHWFAIASLDWVGKSAPVPVCKKRQGLHLLSWLTHTHTHTHTNPHQTLNKRATRQQKSLKFPHSLNVSHMPSRSKWHETCISLLGKHLLVSWQLGSIHHSIAGRKIHAPSESRCELP